MPRVSRTIAVGYPHHITQRGNYRQTVFADAGDYARYLELLADFCPKYGLDIWAYCLMPNHVHLVAVPGRQESLARLFNTVHMLYAQYFNRKRNATGHLWQGRFFSCVLDERHLYAAVRYVEMNPVRGGMAADPQDYLWSSARAHVRGGHDPVLAARCFLSETIGDWGRYLGADEDREATESVIRATKSGHPCGGDDFVRQIGQSLNRALTLRPRGRPRKEKIGTAPIF
ncbi:MAG TPA: transposase [Syntrophales bacterium]|nr:transposase [Syntrophales bacterium]